jgi:hypothetical protein
MPSISQAGFSRVKRMLDNVLIIKTTVDIHMKKKGLNILLFCGLQENLSFN